MNFNKSALAFDDIRELLDRALSVPKGIRAICADRGAAIRLRYRANYLRKLDRDGNRKIYPEEHMLHGKSVYDKLSFRIGAKGTADENVVYLEPYAVGSPLIIEDIT